MYSLLNFTFALQDYAKLREEGEASKIQDTEFKREFTKKNDVLEAEVVKLKEENKELRADVMQLKEENKELRANVIQVSL